MNAAPTALATQLCHGAHRPGATFGGTANGCGGPEGEALAAGSGDEAVCATAGAARSRAAKAPISSAAAIFRIRVMAAQMVTRLFEARTRRSAPLFTAPSLCGRPEGNPSEGCTS